MRVLREHRLFLCALTALWAAAAFAADTRVNVVLLSVDTLRADRLGCYGCPLPTSPNLDRFARGAVLFEDAVCETPLTNPSMGAMLSSRYPRMNGTTRNGLRMPEDAPLVAEQFRAAGYATFCVQSNWTLKAKLSGLDRGFDVYDDDFNKKRWGLLKGERDGDDVTRTALKLLETRDPARPFFAWIHYSDPHAPYVFHRDFNPGGRSKRGLDRREQVRRRYDSEVAYTDFEIGRLLAALPENTAVLFTGDHGESLYEHDYLGHGRRIYQHELRIPLIVRAPGLAAGRRTGPVRGIDVGPTLLGLAGLGKPGGMLGRDLLRGAPAADRVRVVETYGGAVPKVPGVKAVMKRAAPIWQAVIFEGWKLIAGRRKTALYFLPDDPGELEDRSGGAPGRVAALEEMLAAWNRGIVAGTQNEADLTQEDLEVLQSQGYLD